MYTNINNCSMNMVNSD